MGFLSVEKREPAAICGRDLYITIVI